MKTICRLWVCCAFLCALTGSVARAGAGIPVTPEPGSDGPGLGRHDHALLVLHLGVAHPLAGVLLRTPVFDPSATVPTAW